jgi:DNA-binding NarL/FixJ family response regulator
VISGAEPEGLKGRYEQERASGMTEHDDQRVRQLFVVGPPSSKTSELLESFGDAGFEVLASTGLGSVCDRITTMKPVIVLTGDDYLDMLYSISAHGAGCPVVILTHFEHGLDFLTALQAGATGFCEPDASSDAIVRTVNDVLVNGTAIPRPLVATLVAQLGHKHGRFVTTRDGVVAVTDREWEVLSLLRLGRSTAQIADVLFVSAATIRSHVWALVHKLGVEDRESMIALLDHLDE